MQNKAAVFATVDFGPVAFFCESGLLGFADERLDEVYDPFVWSLKAAAFKYVGDL
jgi:hypothetical protein